MHFGAVMFYESPKWLLDCIIFGRGSRRLRHSHQITTNNKAKVLISVCLIRHTIIVPLSNPASRIEVCKPPGRIWRHTFSAFWLRSSVVSVLMTVKSHTEDIVFLIFTIIFRVRDCVFATCCNPFPLCSWHCTPALWRWPFIGSPK